VPSTFVGNHDVTRIASAVGDDRHLPHALAMLFTLAGTPAVYAGDEFGWHAVKEERLGGDDAVRPAFPEAVPDESSLDDTARATLHLVRTLIALRRRNPWLHRAHTDVVQLANEAAVFRTAIDDGAVVTALNIGDEPVELPAAGATVVAAGEATITGRTLRLPPHGWAVLTP
jgi:cyclomaltodextrinase / maltogenic alpha-amylase / neopullulanase